MARIPQFLLIFSFGLFPSVLSLPADRFIAQNSDVNLERLKSENLIGNAEELSGHFEGDIVLTEQQRNYIFGVETFNGLSNLTYRWLNDTVFYQFSPNHTQEQNDYIRKGLDQLESVSCLKFVERTDENDYVQLKAGSGGCYSFVGRRGDGPQVLNLAPYEPGVGCFRLGTIVHEFLHALGFFHMQSGHDRDEYVKIEWRHIISGLENNFFTYNTSIITDFNVPYDYDSIMHYPPYAFSKNGYATIVPHNITYIKTIGQRGYISKRDILKLNAMYECEPPTEVKQIYFEN